MIICSTTYFGRILDEMNNTTAFPDDTQRIDDFSPTITLLVDVSLSFGTFCVGEEVVVSVDVFLSLL